VAGDAWKKLITAQGEGLHVLMPPTTSPSLLGMVARMKARLLREGEASTLERACTRPGARRRADGVRRGGHHAPRLQPRPTSCCRSTATSSPPTATTWPTPASGPRRAASPCPARSSRASTRSKRPTRSTGTAADHRFRTKSSEIPAVAFALAKALGVGGADLGDALASHDPAAFVKNGKKWLQIVAKDLQAPVVAAS
jgi:hypothetical protein